MRVERATADLCDAYADRLQICEPLFQPYGGVTAMHGVVSTVRCFEDNSRIKEAVEGPGHRMGPSQHEPARDGQGNGVQTERCSVKHVSLSIRR